MGLWTAENTTHERRTVTALGRTSGGIAPYIATATYVAFTAAATVILTVAVASVVSANVVVAAAVTFTTTSAFLESDRRRPRTTTPLGRETDLGAVLTL